mmetsp:Transcript_13378/g.40557  ORF Transcript_13378/g.40557 Transcript_13378/m.40557 type:complete len:134 (-) Transcript_13378:145-546(-)
MPCITVQNARLFHNDSSIGRVVTGSSCSCRLCSACACTGRKSYGLDWDADIVPNLGLSLAALPPCLGLGLLCGPATTHLPPHPFPAANEHIPPLTPPTSDKALFATLLVPQRQTDPSGVVRQGEGRVEARRMP